MLVEEEYKINTEHHLYQKDINYAATFLQRKWNVSGRKKILIIGATGLIGSFLADVIIYYNKHIKNQFDLYLMGRNFHRLQKRFRYVMGEETQNVVFNNVNFSTDFKYPCEVFKGIYLWEHDIHIPLMANIEFDYIFQMASNATPGVYALYPVETITTNIQGTINVMEYAKLHPSVQVLFASSMEVYGENGEKKLRESDYGVINNNHIRNGYPESKRVSELLYRSAVQQYGVKSYIARFGYIYGPTMTDSDDKVSAQFIRSALRGEDLVLNSPGLQRRTYCYVLDAVTGMLQIMGSGTVGEVYNVANSESLVTIRRLGEIIAQQVGVKLLLGGIPEGTDLVQTGNKILDCNKLEQIGWEAVVGIEEGVARTIAVLR